MESEVADRLLGSAEINQELPVTIHPEADRPLPNFVVQRSQSRPVSGDLSRDELGCVLVYWRNPIQFVPRKSIIASNERCYQLPKSRAKLLRYGMFFVVLRKHQLS